MSELKPVVLVVEDEAKLRRFIALALESEGLLVHEVETLGRGLIETGTRNPDIIVLDLGLPDGDGLDLIRELRTWSDVPILVLSARNSDAVKVAALDTGADDYLTKPFSATELSARVRAHLRRRSKTVSASQSEASFGKVSVDFGRRIVERDGVPIHLTPIEFRLLSCLMSHPDCVLTHRQLVNAVWGPNHLEDTHYVRIYMGHLRRKVEENPAMPRYILTETGVGYRFVTSPSG